MESKNKFDVALSKAVTYYAHQDVVENYVKYRFNPPTSLVSAVVDFIRVKKDSDETLGLCLDVGCGSGQSTPLYAKYFQQVIGLDVSQPQLAAARTMHLESNVTYRKAPAECLPFEDSSVDLISCCVSAHWFDIDPFFSEVSRVLRPGGVLACCAYKKPLLIFQDLDMTHLLDELLEEWRNYFGWDREVTNKEYLQFPKLYQEELFVSADESKFSAEREFTADELLGFLRSTSFYTRAVADVGIQSVHERLQTLKKRIMAEMKTTEEASVFKIRFNYFLRMWRKPAL